MGNRLQLSSIPAGVELTFVNGDGPFGPPAGQIVVADRVDGVARAVYAPSGGARVELNVLALTDPDGLVFAEFVDDAPEAWEVVGYDEAGVEVHRFGWLPGPATTISTASG